MCLCLLVLNAHRVYTFQSFYGYFLRCELLHARSAHLPCCLQGPRLRACSFTVFAERVFFCFFTLIASILWALEGKDQIVIV